MLFSINEKLKKHIYMQKSEANTTTRKLFLFNNFDKFELNCELRQGEKEAITQQLRSKQI